MWCRCWSTSPRPGNGPGGKPGRGWRSWLGVTARARCGAELDALLVVDPGAGSHATVLAGDRAGRASPPSVKTELAKLAYLRRLDAHTLDLSMLPAERRRFLAGWAVG